MKCRNDAHAVGENFKPIPHLKEAIKECPEEGHNESAFDVECHNIPGPTRRTKKVQRIALFHYVTRSWEDFEAKMARGGGNRKNNSKTKSFFDEVQKYASSPQWLHAHIEDCVNRFCYNAVEPEDHTTCTSNFTSWLGVF
jgi:hypothetical protein